MPALTFLLRLLAWTRLVSAPVAGAEAVEARHGMVVAQEARAARIGVTMLKRGGNAVDAAVATGFALAVTYPRAGNIGGGGYMVIHLANRAQGPRDVAIDYRETAPKAATRDMFLDEKGNADRASRATARSAIGVPGTVAGLALAHRRFGSGRLTLAELIEPAIELAREGFAIEDDTRRFAAARHRPAGALAGLAENVLQATARRSPPATRWCSAISPTRWRRSPSTARAPSTKADRAEDRRRRAGRRRDHDARRSQELPAA